MSYTVHKEEEKKKSRSRSNFLVIKHKNESQNCILGIYIHEYSKSNENPYKDIADEKKKRKATATYFSH